MRKLFVYILLIASGDCISQPADSLRKIYYAQNKAVSNQFSANYYPHLQRIYSLNEKDFIKNIDSLKAPFNAALESYIKMTQDTDAGFISSEHRDIGYFFDKMILDYPYFHENYTGKKIKLSKPVQKKLDRHRADFNKPALLASRDFKNYVQSFLRHASSIELKKTKYKQSDNKRLDAYMNLIPVYFSNPECRLSWQYHYITEHLDKWGSKNTDHTVKQFLATCTNESYKKTVDSLFTESASLRKNHITKTYKKVDGYELDIHLFLPDSVNGSKRMPTIVYFSGGSWTEGNPEWAYSSCASYAKKGWVGVSVEYRLADRHETTPFEAVKDAKTAIRWLRMNADSFHIDPARIVASGNSAGGHLVLAIAMADDWNEETDDLNVSAVPDLLLVNAGVYSLYWDESTAWITRDLKDKELAKKISPLHLLKRNLPPALVIHGTRDNSVSYSSAKEFADKIKELNTNFEFQTLEGAPHYIWFDRRFSGKVAALRAEFLKKHGYE